MKFSILHLSDIHFENESDYVYERAILIAKAAVNEVFADFPSFYVVTIAGDIANKGLSSQYETALKFLATIKEYLIRELEIPVYFVVIPGNHDCNLSKPDKLRDLSIKNVIDDPSSVVPGDEICSKCLEVQKNFFDFVNKLGDSLDYPEAPSIFWRLTIANAGHIILFNCFNTSWLSQINEKQGGLIMPPAIIKEAEKIPDDICLSISLFHHPDNWISADNAIQFRTLLNRISDIIITGHEHHHEAVTQRNIETEHQVQIHRSPVLQDRDQNLLSGFNVIHIDLANKELQLANFEWERNNYQIKNKTLRLKLDRNISLLNGRFELKRDFEFLLKNLNTIPFTHSRRQILQLDDLLVLPRLQVYSLENIIDGKAATKIIQRRDFNKFLFSEKKALLYGETLQGKTTLCKYLFLKARERSVVPILINGELLTSTDVNEILRVIKREFSNQYNGSFEEFSQLPKSRKMIIIDNFGESRFIQADLQKQLSELSKRFDYVFAIAHLDLQLQQYVENEEHKVVFSDYTHCEIRPMNLTQRSELVNKWIKLGRTATSEEDLVRWINEKQQIIENAVDTCMVPPYPSYLLGILQVSDSSNASADKSKFGTIGYLYSSLITSRFEMVSDEIDLGQIYLLLGQMAHKSYHNNNLEISKEDTVTILINYERVFKQPVHLPTFISQVIRAGMLVEKNNRYHFVNYQLRDFFVAEHFSRLLGTKKGEDLAKVHEEIDFIIKTLIYESHTRILLFLVFKAYDKPRFIEQVLNTSKRIYHCFKPARFEEDVDFLNKLKQDAPKPKLLTSGSILDRRETRDRAIDEFEDENEKIEYTDSNKYRVEYKDELSEFIKAAIALKMLEVQGQLLRSFSSTLEGEIKSEIIEEGINLGLRLLESMFQIREADIDDVRSVISELIKEKHSELTPSELVGRADQLLLFAFQQLTSGMLKKISASIGNENLKNIYSDIFRPADLPLSYKMVEVTLRLDHYADPLIEKIMQLSKKLKEDNRFIWDVLRILIANRLNYNIGLNSKSRQQLTTEFELGSIQPYLINVEKSEQKYLPGARSKYTPPLLKSERRRKKNK